MVLKRDHLGQHSEEKAGERNKLVLQGPQAEGLIKLISGNYKFNLAYKCDGGMLSAIEIAAIRLHSMPTENEKNSAKEVLVRARLNLNIGDKEIEVAARIIGALISSRPTDIGNEIFVAGETYLLIKNQLV